MNKKELKLKKYYNELFNKYKEISLLGPDESNRVKEQFDNINIYTEHLSSFDAYCEHMNKQESYTKKAYEDQIEVYEKIIEGLDEMDKFIAPVGYFEETLKQKYENLIKDVQKKIEELLFV